ncbi:unnamed protein product [Closterium sp. Naga37s-1]|nr:unnamed protein product [Closterium sp. Naga37s-1]
MAYLRSRGMLQLDDDNAADAEGQDYDEVGTSSQRTMPVGERGRKRGLPGPPRPGRQQVGAAREAGDGDDCVSDRVSDVNRLSGRGAYVADHPSESRPLREYGWGVDHNETLLVDVHAVQNQFHDVAEAVKAPTQVLIELKEVMKKSIALQENNSTLLQGIQTPVDQSSPSKTNTAVLSPNAGSNVPDEGQHARELRIALGSLVEPKKLSLTGDAGLSMWPDLELVVMWTVKNGVIRENQKEKLLFCLKHDQEHLDCWKDAASRLRGEITRLGKTVVFHFFGIPRSVSDMPTDVTCDQVVCDQERTPAPALADYPLGAFSLPWHCNADGVPFSTWQFEVFIASSYDRCIERQTLRLHPYSVAFALYGAEYPIIHSAKNKTGLPTKDQPNISNTDRNRAIGRNWMRETIIRWGGTGNGPRWIPEESAYQFSAGQYYNVYILFPPPDEVANMPVEIVGREVCDRDFPSGSAPQSLLVPFRGHPPSFPRHSTSSPLILPHSCVDSKGRTPLILASSRAEGFEAAKLLLQMGALVRAYSKGPGGGTSIHYAARKQLDAMVKLLLDHGADPLFPNDDGKTALDLARERNETSVVRLIEVRWGSVRRRVVALGEECGKEGDGRIEPGGIVRRLCAPADPLGAIASERIYPAMGVPENTFLPSPVHLVTSHHPSPPLSYPSHPSPPRSTTLRPCLCSWVAVLPGPTMSDGRQTFRLALYPSMAFGAPYFDIALHVCRIHMTKLDSANPVLVIEDPVHSEKGKWKFVSDKDSPDPSRIFRLHDACRGTPRVVLLSLFSFFFSPFSLFSSLPSLFSLLSLLYFLFPHSLADFRVDSKFTRPLADLPSHSSLLSHASLLTLPS